MGGIDSWRLPKLIELYNLLRLQQKKGRFIDDVFDSQADWIWSKNLNDDGRIWAIGFHNQACNHYPPASKSFVRLVTEIN